MGDLSASRRRIIEAQPHLTTAQSWTSEYSGAVAHFSASAAFPLRHCVVTIPASTTGRDALKITRCGKNLFDVSMFSGSGISVNNGTMSATLGTYANETGKTGAHRMLDGVALDHLAISGYWMMSSNTLTSNGPSTGIRQPPNAAGLALIRVPNSTLTSTYFSSAMPSGTIAYGANNGTCYLSYSDGMNLTATIAEYQIEYGDEATAFEAYNGDTYTVTLPITVYGGTYDLITGELVSTHDSTGALLAEPVVRQLTPQPVNALKGINNVYCPEGLVSVTYYTN